MRDLPERGRLTDALLTYLTSTLELTDRPVLVGDAQAPDAGGWPEQGAGQLGDYAPYVTVHTELALPRDPSTAASAHASWAMGYRLRSFGAVRAQADWAADQVRAAMLGFTGRTLQLGPARWQVTAVLFNQLGAVVPNRATDPPTWQVVDAVGIWLDRHRS